MRGVPSDPVKFAARNAKISAALKGARELGYLEHAATTKEG